MAVLHRFCVLWSMGNKLVPSPHFKSSFYYQQGLKFRYIRHGRAYTNLNLDNRKHGDFTSGCRSGLYVSWIKRRKRFILCKIVLAKQFSSQVSYCRAVAACSKVVRRRSHRMPKAREGGGGGEHERGGGVEGLP